MIMPLIAAHRGCGGGNVHCNTWVSFEAALMQGADIIEIDISRSADGVFFVALPGEEIHHLLSSRPISEMTAEEVKALRYINMDHSPTSLGVSTLDDVLEQLKGRCMVNLDKFQEHPAEIAALVRRHGMQDQVIAKTPPSEEWFRIMEEAAPDLPYMAITRFTDDFSEHLMKRNVRYLGTEALFRTEDEMVGQRSYVERMHKLGLKVWYNAIVCNNTSVNAFVHAAGHNDDLSISGRPDEGWGWLIDQGIDVIQTDWPGMLYQYMHNGYHKKATLL